MHDVSGTSGAAPIWAAVMITTIEDLRVLAKRRVPRMFYDYADSGSWTEGTYRANEATSRRSSCASAWPVNMETAAPAPPWWARTWPCRWPSRPRA
jgi:hypothetical protein